MSETTLQQQYETLPYPHYVHPLTHPAHMATVGHLLGLRAADPSVCSFLDIGCGSATNLLAMAASLPGSRFHGIDFSAPDIASAQALAAEAGLTNITFEHADVLTWNPAGRTFDYVLSYGFFSWVPDEVKDRLLATIRTCLAPNGMALVSYMTYPGCKQPEALRDLLRLRTESLDTPAARVSETHRTLDLLGRACDALPRSPHTSHLRDDVKKIRDKEAHYLLLDDLGVERDPCYLVQFAGWAAEHGLRYLGDSDLPTMLYTGLPAGLMQDLASLSLGPLETEQFLDYVHNRSFRCSLLVGPDATIGPALGPDLFRELCLTPRLKPLKKRKPGTEEARFQSDKGTSVTLRGVAVIAFAETLAAHSGAITPYAEIYAETTRVLGRDVTAAEENQICQSLLTLYSGRQLGLSRVAFTPPVELPAHPCVSPFNAALARHRDLFVSADHRAVKCTPEQQALLPLLDGKTTLDQMAASPAGRALGRHLRPFLDQLSRLGCL